MEAAYGFKIGLNDQNSNETSEDAMIKPAAFYRDAVRKSCFSYRSSPNRAAEDETSFRKYLEQTYEEQHRRLANNIADQSPAAQIIADRLGIAILAVGLFAFGQLDKFDDILEGLALAVLEPRPVKAYWLLGNSLIALLPLPPGLHPQQNPAEIKTWFHTHQSMLRWDEDAGRYILRAG